MERIGPQRYDILPSENPSKGREVRTLYPYLHDEVLIDLTYAFLRSVPFASKGGIKSQDLVGGK